ncbi:DUF305 domain-containing protein [Streptomyces sp. MNU76]|uniref:DUF305 domain-containing protein n=1 Tax=Streptomyces sp. MNU76 TaxID=2560026 RepID=UPI001E570BEF|nr:DUF305 domain-containing protein [Streptomyces sp. MNU76]MCC9705056.1 DUF305 domain-containing protein [Streptomyces sp. MNU76]
MTAFTRTARRTRLRRASATVGIVAVGALLLTACGDDMDGMDHGSDKSSPSASGDAGSSDSGSGDAGSGDFNDADVTFAQMMIPHHEQALDMAELADGRASDTELKDIAEQIEKAQDPEIKAMKGWLRSWGKPTTVESMPGMDHGSGGDGMMSDADMQQLKGMKGTEFDKMFAEMMIQHHNGAITMAEDEQKDGKNDAAVKMAGDIVKGQTAEVEQLGDILDRL